MQHKRATLEGANAGRFFAAMSIVVFHLVGIPKLEIPGYLWFINSYFGQGVPLFYVLSSFALCYGYFGRLSSFGQVIEFYSRRFFRIAPLFYTMICVFNAYAFYLYGRFVSFDAIAASVTFTFNLIPGYTLGFVWASWSIGVEMVFYAVLPFILLAVTSLPRAIIFFVLSSVAAAAWNRAFDGAQGDIATFARFSIIYYAPCFAGGIAAYFIWRRVTWSSAASRASLATALLCIGGLVAAGIGQTVVWAVVLSMLVLGLCFERFADRRLAWLSSVGETSFSLYLWHPFVIICLDRAGAFRAIYAVAPNTLVALAASLALTLAILLPLARVSFDWIEMRLGASARQWLGYLIRAPRRQVDAP